MRDDLDREVQYLGKKLQEVHTLVKQNNKMLRRERSARRLKTFVVLVFFITGSILIFYLFQRYADQITAFQEQVQALHMEVNTILESGRQLGEALDSAQDSVRTILGGS